MDAHFHVETSRHGSQTMLVLSGELDVASSTALEEALGRVGAPPVLLLDLRPLEFIDSTGLGVLVKAHHQSQQAGRRLVIIQGDGQVRRLFTLTGVDEQLTLVEDPDSLGLD